jgi:hypothetical protein
MGEERKVYKVLVEKPEGNSPLERPRHRWMGLEWFLGRLVRRVWSGFTWLRIGIGSGIP